MARPFKCPYCNKTNTTWKGYRKTLTGTKRIRICRNCKKRFTTKRIV
jgi:transcriptional regulator NrdR family protein